jgi:hypothetical protein
MPELDIDLILAVQDPEGRQPEESLLVDGYWPMGFPLGQFISQSV